MHKKSMLLVILLVFLGGILFFSINSKPQNREDVAKQLGLKKVIDIPLSGGTNRWDYQSINYTNNRLYISHLGSNTVTVFDLKTQKVTKDIPLPASPYGILVVPNLKKVFVGVGGNNKVAVIDEKTLQVSTYIQAGITPDGLGYDPHTNKVFITNENGGTVTVIDAKTDERIGDIPVGGSVGNTHFDSISKHVFSVSGNDNTLIEIDPTKNKVVKKYALTDCEHPHGFYIEEQTQYALITCKSNNVMVVFDLPAKKIISKNTIGFGADVLAYDPGLHRLYIAGESGEVTIFTIQKNHIKKIGQAFVADSAHTVSVDKNTHKIYLPLENVNGKPVLRVMEPFE